MNEPDSTMKVINACDVAMILEPYQTCSLADVGLLETAEQFPQRCFESLKQFVETWRPQMKAYREHDMNAVFQSPYYPADQDHFVINGDGLLSICMRVHDDNSYHELATFDNVTQELKGLGRIPRHKFVKNVDASVVCMNDPPYVEGVIGAITDDGNFFVVLAHSKGLRMLNIFNLTTRECVFKTDCSQVSFLACGPSGIALDPSRARSGEFRIAISNEDVEIRVWNAVTLSGSGVKLEDCRPGIYGHRYVINPRESAIKFSPDGRWLSILVYVNRESQCKCVLMNAETLQPCYILPYNGLYSPLCSLFPWFSKCRAKVAMFTPQDYYRMMYIDDYELLIFEAPFPAATLKDLCKSSILDMVPVSKLNDLPLPSDLVEYLKDTSRIIPPHNEEKRQCQIM